MSERPTQAIDADYFAKNLARILHDVRSYTAQEMHLALTRLAEVARPIDEANSSHAQDTQTPLARRLLELREEYISSGGKLYTAEEINAEVRGRRCGEVNPSQVQDVEEQKVLKLAKECGAKIEEPLPTMHWITFCDDELNNFAAKLRAKDAVELKKADDTITLLLERNSEHAATIAQHKDEIASLKAQLAEAQKDANRYRFIRNQDGYPTPEKFDVIVDNDMAAAPTYKKED